MDKQYFTDLAMQLGAAHAVPFHIDDIVFDPRTLLKCMYGCKDWGKGHTCPSRPGSPDMQEYERIFRRYTWGVIIHSPDKKVSQEVSFEVERQAFFKGYHFAFSLSDCARCSQCAGFKGVDCVHPDKARPAFHSIGIDVFSTVRKFGLPIGCLVDKGEAQNWYSAVFIE